MNGGLKIIQQRARDIRAGACHEVEEGRDAHPLWLEARMALPSSRGSNLRCRDADVYVPTCTQARRDKRGATRRGSEDLTNALVVASTVEATPLPSSEIGRAHV